MTAPRMNITDKRLRARYLADYARYQAENNKPPTRAQIRAWLEPMRRAFDEMRSGEMDAYRGYAITRINPADEDFARVDFCINGFVSMLARLAPEFDTGAMKKVSKKLEAGILLELQEVDACLSILKECEVMMRKFTRGQLKDAAQTEQVVIELERLGAIEE